MHPAGSAVVSRWYYVNAEGMIEQGLTFTVDANNKVYQRTIFQGDAWLNVTLKQHGFDANSYAAPAVSNQLGHYLAIQEAIQFLEMALRTEKQAGEVRMQAYQENGRYHYIGKWRAVSGGHCRVPYLPLLVTPIT